MVVVDVEAVDVEEVGVVEEAVVEVGAAVDERASMACVLCFLQLCHRSSRAAHTRSAPITCHNSFNYES